MISYPWRAAVAITPSDGAAQGLDPNGCDALHISVAGALSVVMKNGATVVFPSVPAGQIHLNVIRVNATNTAATGIVALWN